MKKFLVLLLAVVMLLSLCSCNSKKDDTPESQPNASGQPADDSDNSKNKVDEKAAIKQNVLDLIRESDKQKDPATLLSYFDGDYEISNFTQSNEQLRTIKRKNAVSVVSASIVTYYCVEAAGFSFYVADYNGESEVIGALPLTTDNSEKSTIFTTFGIDTGSIYGLEAETEPIELTKEMLSVSDDNTTCTFSKEYLDEIAKLACESFGYTDTQTSTFLNKYTGSGVYSVAENKVTFDIKLQDRSLGNFHQTTSYMVDQNGKVNAYSLLEYSNPSLGISTPIKAEIIYKDVVYKNNEPVSATIQVITSSDTSYYDGDYYGAPYITSTTTTETTFTLDCSNASAPKATALCKKTSTESYQGEKSTYKTELKLSVDLGKSSSQFNFTEKQNGDVIDSLKANKVTFGTPSSFPSVPQRVTNCITKYITNNL